MYFLQALSAKWYLPKQKGNHVHIIIIFWWLSAVVGEAQKSVTGNSVTVTIFWSTANYAWSICILSCFHHFNVWRCTHINLSKITDSLCLCLRACLFHFHHTFSDQYAHLFAEKKNTIPMMLTRQSKYSCLILSSIYHPQQLAFMTAFPFS